MMKIYLDACAISRLTDDQRQERIFAETQAIREVLRECTAGTLLWVSSYLLEAELTNNRNLGKRLSGQALLTLARERVSYPDIAQLTPAWPGIDARHLLCAQAARCDVLLTTDDRFLKRAAASGSSVRVRNPVDWMRERTP